MVINDVIKRAEDILAKSNAALTPADKREQAKYAEMMKHPQDKILLMKLMDESTQITDQKTLVKRIEFLHKKYGMLHFLTWWEKVLFNVFVSFGRCAPALSVPMFKKYLRSTTSKVIIDEAHKPFKKHINKRQEDKVGQNVNLIGEVVLGEGEALKRYEHYLEALTDPLVSYVSIKVSGIFSQLHPLNYDEAKGILIERLSALYRQAIKYPTEGFDGVMAPKFINMDMEEYKDMELTYEVFTETLDKEEFKDLYAGLVLQAYIPDSIDYQKRLIEWSKKRVARGGSPIKMRLVKGANLQMETVISSLKHWENPVFDGKTETDANYLKMIDYGFQKENIEAVNMGIASHNLFSIAYAQLTAEKNGVQDYISFEVLEGMANNLVKALKTFGFNLVLYTPVVTDENFLNAVSYLVRRLDENTGPENFIAHSFGLEIDDKSWKFLRSQFKEAIDLKSTIVSKAKRIQNRANEVSDIKPIDSAYTAEPDTDFDLGVNINWTKSIIEKWKFDENHAPIQLPTYVGAEMIETTGRKLYIDNSQDGNVPVYSMHLHTPEQVEKAVEIAENDPAGWSKLSSEERHEIFAKVAQKMRAKRGDFIGCMMAVTGKTAVEGDVEVSEAVDFVEYYPRSVKQFESIENIKVSEKGVVLVIPPWNFPLAIPVGGVVAGLAAGNRVIIKPATVSAPIAYEFVMAMHEAGVPKEALQLILPENRDSLNYLTKHESIKHIILTGGTETAYRILDNNPKVALSAETGGKNAMIITASADSDISISSAVAAAFGNAGQKCSACSLLLLHKDLYDNPVYASKLKDAAESLYVGSPWDLSSEIGPMINPDTDNKELIHAIENLESGESWLVKPEVLDKKRFTLKPGIKWGVKKGNYTFNTELFAPLLSVVRFETLEEAIDMVNSTGYGLTSGLQSLDEREHEIWKSKIEAGNLYINRGITGAIVQRQPFGGMKESAFGNGIKAGGPNYVSCFMNIEQTENISSTGAIDLTGVSASLKVAIGASDNKDYITAAINSYRTQYKEVFSKSVDVSNIIGEDNHFRYIPALGIGVRVEAGDDLSNLLMIAAAAEVTKTPLAVSISPEFEHLSDIQNIFSDLVVESETEFCDRAPALKRLRLCREEISENLYEKIAKKGVCIIANKPLQEGRIELLNYLQEQSVTTVYHRYGNLGDRE